MGLIKSSRSSSEVQEWPRIKFALNHSLFSGGAALLGRIGHVKEEISTASFVNRHLSFPFL